MLNSDKKDNDSTTEKEYTTMANCSNNRPCPCTYDCPRHGKCCECVAHHRDNNEGVKYSLQWEFEQGHTDIGD